MKIAIVGWGVEGQSAFKFFGPDNDYLIVNEHPRDDFPAPSPSVKLQFLRDERPVGMVGNVADLSYLDSVDSYDKIIYSPTSYKNLEQKFAGQQDFWNKATTVQNIFFENCKTKNIIGVTGTKGKGTTATIIYKMLVAGGKKVYLGGNIGNSMLDFVKEVQPDDWVVLELSNFQLHRFTHSPSIAICLMVVPEHLDWHMNMGEYTEAKTNIFRHQKPKDVAIYFADNQYSTEIASSSPGKKIPYYKKPGAYVRDDGMIVIGDNETPVISKTEVKLLGEHNLQNICAAITAVWQVTQELDSFKTVLSSFSGLEHRLELVRSLNGVKYYDDSFGTTPETAIVAIKAFKEPKVLILGGSDKGIAFDELADEIAKNNIRQAIIIGETTPKITDLLKSRNFTNIVTGLDTMPAIVAAAQKAAQPGDVALLSTGCASFGLFKDYKDRGDQFKQAVLSLS